MQVARVAVVVVQIVRQDHRVSVEHLAVLQQPLAPVAQNRPEIGLRLVREGELHGVLVHLAALVHLLHHVQHDGVPEKAAIFVLVQFALLRGGSHALLGSRRVRELLGVAGQDRD